MNGTKKNTRVSVSTKLPLTTRLIFSYEGEEMRLVSRKTIQKIPPVSDRLTSQDGECGFWYEVRDAKSTTLFRRVMQNPMKQFAEIRSDNANRPFTWGRIKDPAGVLMILFPEMKEAVEVVFFSSGPQVQEKKRPARIIARYSLKNNELRKEG